MILSMNTVMCSQVGKITKDDRFCFIECVAYDETYVKAFGWSEGSAHCKK